MNRIPQVNRNTSIVAWIVVLAVAALAIGYVAGGFLIKSLGGKSTEQVKSDEITGQVVTDDSAAPITNSTTNSPGATITPDLEQGGGLYIVQLGAFGSRENAEKLKNELLGKGFQNVTVTEGPLYKVQLDKIPSQEEASQLRDQIKDAGYVDVFVSVH